MDIKWNPANPIIQNGLSTKKMFSRSEGTQGKTSASKENITNIKNQLYNLKKQELAASRKSEYSNNAIDQSKSDSIDYDALLKMREDFLFKPPFAKTEEERRQEYSDFFDASRFEGMYAKSDEQLLDEAANMQGPAFDRKNASNMKLSDPFSIDEGLVAEAKAMGLGTTKGAPAFWFSSSGEIMSAISTAEMNGMFDVMTNPGEKLYSPGSNGLKNPHGTDLFLDEKLESAAALHAFYKAKATKYYQGEELEQLLGSIDASFEKNVERLADDFCGHGDWISGDEQGVRRSILDMYGSKKDFYDELAASGGFMDSVANVTEEWALDDAYFMTAKLRQYAKANPELERPESGARYSAEDLKAIALVRYTTQAPSPINPLYANEEEIGAQYGYDAILMDLVLSQDGLSNNVRQLIRNSFYNSLKYGLEASEKEKQFQRTDPYTDHNVLYDSLNENAVWSTVNEMLSVLQKPAEEFESALRNVLANISERHMASRQQHLESGGLQARYMFGRMQSISFDAFHFNLLVNYIGQPERALSPNLFGFDEFA